MYTDPITRGLLYWEGRGFGKQCLVYLSRGYEQ